MADAREPPKYMMLSGALLRAWAWDRVIPLLDGPVMTLDLPGAATEEEREGFSLDEAMTALTARVRATAKDVVLVGHSIGGVLAAGIAHRAPERVRAVVFLGSYLPPRGEAHVLLAPFPVRALMRVVFALKKTGVRASDAAIRKEYCNDLDETTTAEVLAKAVPEPPRLFTTPIPWDPRPPAAVAVTYVRLTGDRAVSLQTQDAAIARLGEPSVASIDSGHLPMLSRPRELAAVLKRV